MNGTTYTLLQLRTIAQCDLVGCHSHRTTISIVRRRRVNRPTACLSRPALTEMLPPAPEPAEVCKYRSARLRRHR